MSDSDENKWPEFDPTSSLQETSVEKLRLLVDRWWLQRQSILEMNKVQDLQQKTAKEIQREIFRIFEATGLERFDGSFCLVSKVVRRKYQYPTDPKAREDFDNYLKDHGLDHMRTIHSGTLNAWLKIEQEIAEGLGKSSLDIPGLGSPQEYADIMARSNE